MRVLKFAGIVVILGSMLAWAAPAAAQTQVASETALLNGVARSPQELGNYLNLAQLYFQQGRYDEAEQLTRESEEAARPNDIHSHILWRTTRSQVFAQRGELRCAEELALEAVAFASRSDFLDSHGDALMHLAELHLQTGRTQEAVAHVEEALRLAEDKGVEDFLAFATSAVREAANGEQVLARIDERCGTNPEQDQRTGDVPVGDFAAPARTTAARGKQRHRRCNDEE